MWFWIVGRLIRWGMGLFLLGGMYFIWTTYGCKQIQGNEMAGKNQPNSHFAKDTYKLVYLKERTPEILKYDDVVFYDYRFKSHLGGNRDQTAFTGRIVGKPADRIRMDKGFVIRNGEKLTEEYLEPRSRSDDDMEEIVVPIGSYFILCDNRREGKKVDSRAAGPVGMWSVLGRVKE